MDNRYDGLVCCRLVGLELVARMGRGRVVRATEENPQCKRPDTCFYRKWAEIAISLLGSGVVGEGDPGGPYLDVGNLGWHDGFVEREKVQSWHGYESEGGWKCGG